MRFVEEIKRELSPKLLPSSLMVGLLAGVMDLGTEISLAAYIFSGDLSQFLAGGIGVMLFGALVFGVVVALITSVPGVIAVPQDTPAAILADGWGDCTQHEVRSEPGGLDLRLRLWGCRAVLVRDPNRLVSSAVLGSPRMTDGEVEAFAGMRNVSDEVLRQIGNHRERTKRYGVVSALVKNPRTPLAVSLGMVARLNPRDIKSLTTDRNVPEVRRRQAQKFVQVAAQKPATGKH